MQDATPGRTGLLWPRASTLHAVLAMTAGLTCLASPRVNAADAGVQLNRSFFSSTIEASINESLKKKPSSLRWQDGVTKVELSSSGTSVHVHLNMSTSIKDPVPDPEVAVDFDMTFDCQYYREAPPQEAQIGLGISTFQVDVNYPWWIDVGTAGVSLVFEQIGNEVADMQSDATNAIRTKTMMKLNDLLGGLKLSYCPEIAAVPDAGIRFTLDPGSECSDGDIKDEEPCPVNYRGSGRYKICVGGHWALRDSCDRITPPGQNPP